jgi:phosphosulfolactate phosphohydrolase-like enzyme
MEVRILPPHRFEAELEVTVVIDVFRFTTTAAVLTARSDGDLYVVPTLEQLDRVPVESSERWIFSELEACRHWPERRDNSPVEAARMDLRGRTPVLVTTNGTRTVGAALERSAKILLGSFVNFGAVVEHVRSLKPRRVTLAPAGRFDRAEPRFEDDRCAEAYFQVLRGGTPDFARIRSACLADPRTLRRIEGEGDFEADAKFALEVNRVAVVPEATAVHTPSGAGGVARVWKAA